MKMISHYLALFICSFLLSGCVSVVSNKANNSVSLLPPIEINSQLFSSENTVLIRADEVFELTQAQQQAFLSYYQEEIKKGVKANRVLYNFLQSRLDNFTYYGETYVAQKSMALNTGNCMSLAIMTTALAQVVGLEVDYRQVNTLPVFEQHNNIVLSASHVQAVIYEPDFAKEKNTIYYTKPALVIDYFPASSNQVSTRILKENLLAQYYRNIAADNLVDNDLNHAFVNAEAAYQYDETSAEMLNLLAVLHRRAGDNESAENFYNRAIKLGNTDLELLSNYAVLLKKMGRNGELISVQKKISKLYDPNPYSWLEQAYIAQRSNQFRTAEKYYLKVIELAPYVHQAYIGLYQIYAHKNQKYKAKSILKDGLKWTYSVEDKGRFKNKLYSLASQENTT